MSKVAWVWADPYAGLAASVVTSNVIDFRDAQAATLSWYTTAGTVSAHTLFVSNSSVDKADDVSATVGWVAYVGFGTGTPAGIPIDPGFRWGQIRKVVSGSSIVVDINKLI